MGIIYNFAIRYISVWNIEAVDERCVSEYDDDFEEHLEKAKRNCRIKLKEVFFEPTLKRGYVVSGISIPEGTEVITFGNGACNHRGGGHYRIHFYYEDESSNYTDYICAETERNRFMIILNEINDSLPMKMDYEIDSMDDYSQDYTEEDCDVII